MCPVLVCIIKCAPSDELFNTPKAVNSDYESSQNARWDFSSVCALCVSVRFFKNKNHNKKVFSDDKFFLFGRAYMTVLISTL